MRTSDITSMAYYNMEKLADEEYNEEKDSLLLSIQKDFSEPRFTYRQSGKGNCDSTIPEMKKQFKEGKQYGKIRGLTFIQIIKGYRDCQSAVGIS